MPYCPSCRGEFHQGVTHCRKCRRALVEVLKEECFGEFYSPSAMAELLVGQEVLPAFNGSVAAITELRDAFALKGIPVAVANDPDACMSCQPRLTLLAKADDLDRAIDFFCDEFHSELHVGDVQVVVPSSEESEQGADGEVQCPACSASYTPGSDAECPECGLFLG